MSLNGRNYIDVQFPAPPDANATFDPASITDATPEFTLSGDGRGDVTLNPGEAPVPIGNDGRTFRYWVHGDFADGPLEVNFIPGSWAYTFALTNASQSIASSTTDLGVIDVTFPLMRATRWISPPSWMRRPSSRSIRATSRIRRRAVPTRW